MVRPVRGAALCGAAWPLAALQVLASVLASVPPPFATPAKIIVSGRTSTAVDIKIVKVGQEIPKTYAGAKIRNTPGFEFYVSEHYALKTNMDEAFARTLLEVSELAYPHWAAVVGAEPPDPETRMCLVYARNVEELRQAMVGDIGAAPASFAGGFTAYANRSAYNFPSGTLQYHMRGLTIHENLHMLNMVCNGTGGAEGMTYVGEQHVYDAAKKRLTVACFDKAPVNNYTAEGLAALRKEFIPMPEAVKKLWYGGGGPASVYHLFFFTDPDRFLKWRIWRDQFYAGRVSDASNAAVMEDIFGPLDRLNEDWERWVKARRTTFHHVDWGWDQDGDALMAYGFPWDAKYWSQMDIPYPPGEPMAPDPLRMDYPTVSQPSIVGPIRRGTAEPSVGYVADLTGGGWVGLGLGVSGRAMCQVTLTDGKLVIEGKELPIPRREFALPPDLQAAGRKAGNRYGVTIQIKAAALAVTVRSTPSNRFQASVPLEPAPRTALMTRPVALVAKDGRPKITPYFDETRTPTPDLMKPAPANRWRFAGFDQLETLYRAAWRLKDQTPDSLLKLKAEMLAAVDKDSAAQATATAAYEARIVDVARDVRACAAAPQAKALALAELAGVAMTFQVRRHDVAGKLALETRLHSRLPDGVEGTLSVALKSEAKKTPVAAHPLAKLSRRIQEFTDEAPMPDAKRPLACTATAELRWRGEPFSLTLTQTLVNPTIPRWWTIGPFDNKGGPTADTPQPVETGAANPAGTHVGVGGKRIGWKKAEQPANAGFFDDFVLDLAALHGGTNVSAYALARIDSPKEQDAILKLGSDDGVVAWLNGSLVHKNLAARGYAPRQDRVPIRLKAGHNSLLVRVTQGAGGWAIGACLLDLYGQPLVGLTYPTK